MYSKGCFFLCTYFYKFLYSQKRLRQPEFCICFENSDQLQTVCEQNSYGENGRQLRLIKLW